MKQFTSALRLTIVLIVFFGLCYPLFIWAIGRLMPNASEGLPIEKNGKIVGYENIGQNFTDDKYFWGRPSAVNYNAASTGGSNLGPSNPALRNAVQARVDTFLVHNPGIKASDIPIDLVTTSGSGLDPHISPEAARIQIARIARVRGITAERLQSLVESHIERPTMGIFGISRVNALRLNLALDELK
jgi:potassium-transporting ATPase KdpC subunit